MFAVKHSWMIGLTAILVGLRLLYDKITKPTASIYRLAQAGFVAALRAI